MGAFLHKIRNKALEPIAGAYVSNIWNMFHNFLCEVRTLYALVWTLHDESVHAQDCITSFFQSAWFGKKKVFAATLGRPNRGRTAQRKNDH